MDDNSQNKVACTITVSQYHKKGPEHYFSRIALTGICRTERPVSDGWTIWKRETKVWEQLIETSTITDRKSSVHLSSCIYNLDTLRSNSQLILTYKASSICEHVCMLECVFIFIVWKVIHFLQQCWLKKPYMPKIKYMVPSSYTAFSLKMPPKNNYGKTKMVRLPTSPDQKVLSEKPEKLR